MRAIACWRRCRGRPEAKIALSIAAGAASAGAAFGARARRRADVSEARYLLAGEQAALRRVATLVAHQPSPAEVFTAVTEEVGRLLGADIAAMHVYPGDGMATTVAGWSEAGPLLPVGTRLALDGESVVALVFRTGASARMDSYVDVEGSTAEVARGLGLCSTVGAPIVVDDLSLIGKQLHWTVVGPLFRPLHLQLDELVDSWRELADTVAERAVALGFVPDGQAQAVAAGSPLTPVAQAALEDHVVIRELTHRIAEVSELVRKRMNRLGEVDIASQDVLIEVVRTLEKQQWMLRVQLEGRA